MRQQANGGSAVSPMAVLLDGRMAQPMSTPQELPTAPMRGLVRAMLVGGAGLGVAAVLGAVVLWFNYGTAVFFEMIASGIAACF